MSKIAKYLSGHLIGEISAKEARLKSFSTDRSILRVQPSLVMFPRITDDLQKIMRFSSQLADKGHKISITSRGYGGSTDGSSIGDGIVVDISRHLNKIKELDLREKTVKVEAGANFQKLNLAIGAQAMAILPSPAGERLTVGGAIAMNLPSEKYNYGTMAEAVLEATVVLSNGDVATFKKLNKKELSEKLALTNFEGEIYRSIDNLIEDNYDLIQEIDGDASYGYSGIKNVKDKDGNFNLVPLLFGSLGTLGTITEVVIKTDFIVNETNFAVVSFANRDDARDFIDEIEKLNPDIIEMFDGKMFESAIASGKNYQFYMDRVKGNLATKLVLVVGVSDRNQRKIRSTIAKIESACRRFNNSTMWLPDDSEVDKAELESIRDVREVLRARAGVIKEEIYPIQGVFIPLERFEEFYLGLQKLALYHNIPAPIQGSALTCIFEILAEFDFNRISDRQKALRFIVDLAKLLAKVDGEMAYGAGEGRIFGNFISKNISRETEKIFNEIRTIFDSKQILNIGVKGRVDAKEITKLVRNGR